MKNSITWPIVSAIVLIFRFGAESFSPHSTNVFLRNRDLISRLSPGSRKKQRTSSLLGGSEAIAPTQGSGTAEDSIGGTSAGKEKLFEGAFKGILRDCKMRFPFYKSDVEDGLNVQVSIKFGDTRKC